MTEVSQRNEKHRLMLKSYMFVTAAGFILCWRLKTVVNIISFQTVNIISFLSLVVVSHDICKYSKLHSVSNPLSIINLHLRVAENKCTVEMFVTRGWNKEQPNL